MYVSTKTLRLLGPAWTRAFRCVWMLEELGLPYEIVLDSLPVSRKVRKYVSTGKVPVLLEYDHPTDEYPSFVLSESAAINTYLADHYRGVDKGLIPPAYTQQRARYDEAVSCIVTELDSQGLWIHRKHEAMAQHFGAIPAAVQHAEQHFNRINAHVCQPLVSSPYLLGDEFTAADILYVHCLDWSKGIGWHTHWPAIVHEYRDRCHSRPAYQRAVKARDGDKKDRDALLKQSMSSSNSNNDTATTSKL